GRLHNDLLEVGGMKTGGFEDMVRRINERYSFDIRDGGGGRGPSDHTNFYLRDIPVLFFFTGLHKQYHRPEDDTPLLNIDGAMRIGRFVSDVITTIDTSPEAPKFTRDTRGARIGRQSDEIAKKDAPAPPAPPQVPVTPNPAPTPRPGHPVGVAAGASVQLGVMPAEDDG